MLENLTASDQFAALVFFLGIGIAAGVFTHVVILPIYRWRRDRKLTPRDGEVWVNDWGTRAVIGPHFPPRFDAESWPEYRDHHRLWRER